jgi:hypothetical protein
MKILRRSFHDFGDEVFICVQEEDLKAFVIEKLNEQDPELRERGLSTQRLSFRLDSEGKLSLELKCGKK